MASATEERPNMQEQIDYYRLCDAAARLGIPVSLDDPRSPRTVQALRDAVETAKH